MIQVKIFLNYNKNDSSNDHKENAEKYIKTKLMHNMLKMTFKSKQTIDAQQLMID